MILAINIGNSNIIFGLHDGEKFVLSSRIKTEPLRTETEHAVLFSNIMRINKIDCGEITGAVISSVVPGLTNVVKKAIGILGDIPVTVVAPGVKTGLNIRIDDPASLASDHCCTAVGAISKYPLPAIIIDLGTATKITVVNEKREYIGGSIAPGVMVSLGALANSAALLPAIDITGELKVIGTETTQAMLSGILLGTASMLDGMIGRFEKEIGKVKTVVACGGLAKTIAPYCERDIIIDRDLLLDGLLAIYKKNM